MQKRDVFLVLIAATALTAYHNRSTTWVPVRSVTQDHRYAFYDDGYHVAGLAIGMDQPAVTRTLGEAVEIDKPGPVPLYRIRNFPRPGQDRVQINYMEDRLLWVVASGRNLSLERPDGSIVQLGNKSSDEVRALLGQPDELKTNCWVYNSAHGSYQVYFRDGRTSSLNLYSKVHSLNPNTDV